MSEKVEGQIWKKYSPEFKRDAVDRMVAGESPTALERELGMRRKFLYAWRDAGWGSQGGAKAKARPTEKEPESKETIQLKARIEELERLSGQQAAELDFFVAALRSVKGARRKSGADSDEGSTK